MILALRRAGRDVHTRHAARSRLPPLLPLGWVRSRLLPLLSLDGVLDFSHSCRLAGPVSTSSTLGRRTEEPLLLLLITHARARARGQARIEPVAGAYVNYRARPIIESRRKKLYFRRASRYFDVPCASFPWGVSLPAGHPLCSTSRVRVVGS